MKHFLKSVAIMVSIGLCSVSCNNEMPLTDTDTEAPDAKSKIADMIKDVHGAIHSGTRAENDNYTIKSIETKVYEVPDSLLGAETRSMSNSTYAIHTVTLNFGDTEGFTILSDTPGIDHVFFYTESGCIADTANNVALKDMVECTPLVALNILEGTASTDPTTRAGIDIEPLVPYQWHQGHPFNYYATFCQCSSCSSNFLRQHRKIGCVNVAVGQTIATVKKFTGTFYGNRDIDFENLTKKGNCNNDSEVIDVAHFLGEIALNTQTKFRCENTYTSMEAAAKYLRDLGYLVDHKTGVLDKARFVNYISRGIPHIISGKNSAGEVHAWVLDGVKVYNGKYQYHHNWGEGENCCDGWASEYYYGTIQHTGQTEYLFYQYISSLEQLYITIEG